MRDRPQAGDRVMSCKHRDAPSWHFWEIVGGLLVTRPNGSKLHVRWAVCCSDCFAAANGVMQAVLYQADFVLDAAPNFKEPS